MRARIFGVQALVYLVYLGQDWGPHSGNGDSAATWPTVRNIIESIAMANNLNFI
jgi:hypothetical protein